MADEEVENWTALSSVTLRKYVDKKISILLSDNTRKVGWVHSIDPVTHTVVLQEETEDSNAKKLSFVLGHAISRVVLEESEGHPPKTDFLQAEKTMEYSQDDLCKRKSELVDWLTKNRIPVSESLEDSAILSVMGVLFVEPPYDAECCRCSNEIVLDRIQKLIRAREDHNNETNSSA
ncbi:gem-associated protein 6-like [Oculina patagonica]